MTPKKYIHLRRDLVLMSELVDYNSRVLDIGCGKGELLHKLIVEKNVDGHGVEIGVDNIISCIEKGVPVINADIDEGLGDYPDQSFDFVILGHTLQVVKRPHIILTEMLRIGKTGIVSVPNFGYIKVRNQLYFKGRMPRTKTLPFEWYDTPNIHLLTIKDFTGFCKKENVRILKQLNLSNGKPLSGLKALFPNLFAEMVIFVIQNGE